MRKTTPRSKRNPRRKRADCERLLVRLDRWARLLDTRFRIPFTPIRFGLDPLIGLLPGLGDAIGLMLSSTIFLQALRYRVPLPLLVKMLGNMGAEFVIGVIPIMGTFFDVYWRANIRNVALLREVLLPDTVAPETPQKRYPRLRKLMLWLLFAFSLALIIAFSQSDKRLIPDYRAWFQGTANSLESAGATPDAT